MIQLRTTFLKLLIINITYNSIKIPTITQGFPQPNTINYNTISSSPLFLTKTKASPSTIVDVDYEYDEEQTTNKTRFNILSLTPTSKIVEVQSQEDVPTSYIIPIRSSSKYVMIDVPPYTKDLYEKIQSFTNNTNLAAILITNVNSIYYNNNELSDESNYYQARQSDLSNWKSVYPDLEVVMHRIDIPRDSRQFVTQVLDGYGPFAYNDTKFIETGRPMTVIQWDDDKLQSFMEEDISNDEMDKLTEKRNDIERNTDIIAMYTPGHTSGSISYIFPKLKVCCSGFTIPIEKQDTGIRLDYKGYITTNKGGLKRQVESVNEMYELYGDSIDVIAPSRGGVYYLPLKRKKEALEEIIERFRKVGDIYESLGI